MELGSVADWVVAATAIVGVIFGGVQLRALREADQQSADQARAQAEIARATLLLEIDGKFESADLLASRIAVRTLRNRAIKEAKTKLRAGANDIEVRDRACVIFSEYVTQLWVNFTRADESDPNASATRPNETLADEAGSQYSQLVRLLGWMETVGRLTEQRLVPPEDMFELYDQVFIQVWGLFRQHTADRRADGPVRNDRLWHYAGWFSDAAEARQKRRAESVPRTLASDRKWLGVPPATPHNVS